MEDNKQNTPPNATSRKNFILTLVSFFLVTTCFFATGFYPATAAAYPTLVMAIVTILGAAYGTHIGNKWILAKHGVLSKEEMSEELIKESKDHIDDPRNT